MTITREDREGLPALAIAPTCSTPKLQIWRHKGSSGRLVLVFLGVGRDPEAVQEIEFARSATQNGLHDALFIADTQRSWLNAVGLIDRIRDEVAGILESDPIHEICTLGHSMGGFCALAMPAFLADLMVVKSAVALAPQVSVHPDIAGDDRRWMRYRSQIKEFRVAHACDNLVPETGYHVVFGDRPREAPQRNRVPIAPNLNHLILRGTAHNVPARMKRFGLLDAVLKRLMDNKPVQARALLDSIGVSLRDLEQFPMRPTSRELSEQKLRSSA